MIEKWAFPIEFHFHLTPDAQEMRTNRLLTSSFSNQVALQMS